MKTALLLSTLVILGAVAVAPTASADHIDCISDLEVVQVACVVGNATLHYAECYLFTGPAYWLTQCV